MKKKENYLRPDVVVCAVLTEDSSGLLAGSGGNKYDVDIDGEVIGDGGAHGENPDDIDAKWDGFSDDNLWGDE
ncbi:MAG: hypothetical protein ACI350_06435 [Prevotella sp.]